MDSEPLQGFAAGRLAPCTSPESHGIGVLPHARNLLSLLTVHTSRTVWLQKEEICFYPHLLVVVLTDNASRLTLTRRVEPFLRPRPGRSRCDVIAGDGPQQRDQNPSRPRYTSFMPITARRSNRAWCTVLCTAYYLPSSPLDVRSSNSSSHPPPHFPRY